jgi:hypothetical protein
MSNRNGSRICASSVSFRPPHQHTKLRVALVCLVWGEEFADFFARYCIPSLLEPQNLPLVSRDHDVTLLLCADRATQEFLDRCDSFRSLCRFAKIELLPLEQLPATARTNHWVPWQHAVAGRNRDFDRFLVIIYDRAREFPDAAGAKYIALAVAAPGFHRHLRRLQSGFTVVLPKSERGFREVVKRIERHPAAKELLRRFLFLHVVPGQLPIVPGHAIFLTYSDAADDFPKAFVVDQHTVALGAGLLGKTISPLQWVWEKVFSLKADIDYSHLTWSMLDPLHGTSERVLDHSVSTDATGDAETLHSEMSGADPPNAVLPADCTLHNEVAGADPPNGVLPADCGSAGPDGDHALVRRAGLHIVTEGASHVAFTARSIANFGIVKACDLAIKLPLMGRLARFVRHLYRKGRGRPRLSIEDAGISPPVLRLAGREARDSPAEPELSVSHQPLLTESARASYDAISKLNIADNVAKITLVACTG